jgi:hypothetical protein
MQKGKAEQSYIVQTLLTIVYPLAHDVHVVESVHI